MVERFRDLGSETSVAESIEASDPLHNLTIQEIADIRQRHWTWVVRRVAPMKDELEITEDTPVRQIKIPKNVFAQIDSIDKTEKPAEDWETTAVLAEKIGVRRQWVVARILKLESTGEFRISLNGPRFHLPPEAHSELAEIRNRVAISIDRDKFSNVTQLSNLVGRSPVWVNNRLESMDVEPILALDAIGRPSDYYPNTVADFLFKEKSQLVEAQDELTIRDIANALGKSYGWVRARIEQFEIKGDYKYFAHTGRIDLCFGTDVFIFLQEVALTYRKAKEGWRTEGALSVITGRADAWVHKRLQEMNTRPKIFADKAGNLRSHYSPRVERELKRMTRAWESSDAIKYGLNGEDKAGKFRDAHDKSGIWMTEEEFEEIGVTANDMKYWAELELINQMSDGRYYFTQKGKQVAQRITETEELAEKIRSEMAEAFEEIPT